MKKFVLINHGTNTRETIETPLTVKQWIAIHFGAWGFYQITKTGAKEYAITDKFNGVLCYTIKL